MTAPDMKPPFTPLACPGCGAELTGVTAVEKMGTVTLFECCSCGKAGKVDEDGDTEWQPCNYGLRKKK